jgi:hypothetical protein
MAIFTKDNIGIALLTIAFGLMLTSFIIVATTAGSKDDFAALRGDMTTIIVVNSIAIFALIAGIMMFYARFAQNAHIYNLVIGGISMFMAFTALSISVISKV